MSHSYISKEVERHWIEKVTFLDTRFLESWKCWNCCPKLTVIGRIFFFAAFFLNKINTNNNEGKKAHIPPKTEDSSAFSRERHENQVIKALLERIGVRGF